jgi:hypothetical protein
VRTVLFLTDGDVANDGEILALTRRFDPATRLFTVGIGMAPSAGVLTRLARLGGGTALFVNDSQDIEAEIRRFESTFVGPMACGLGVQGARRHSGRDLFAGRAATFFIEGSPRTVDIASVDGRFHGAATVARAPIALGALWARDRVAELEDRLVTDPSQQGLIDPEIAELGVRHQIQTRLTSFVAIDEGSEVHGEPLRIVQPTDAPRDVCFEERMAVMASLPPEFLERRKALSNRAYKSVMNPTRAMRDSAAAARPTPVPPDIDAELAFAVAAVSAHDPSQPMTLRIAVLVVFASLAPGFICPPELLQAARDHLAAEAPQFRESDPWRFKQLIRLTMVKPDADPRLCRQTVLHAIGATQILDI